MRILQVTIENFRGISEATIRLPAHALILGPNNACKSTILEALDLTLGPDRIRGADPIDEHDFFRGRYTTRSDHPEDEEEEPPDEASPTPAEEGNRPQDNGDAEEDEIPKIRIDIVLGDLNQDQLRRFRSHLEVWHLEEFRLLTADEAQDHVPDDDDFVLRVGFRGWYDQELDEFDAETVFLHPPRPAGARSRFGRRDKQRVGFLYLRSLRTGRRAATLQRGSLLDVLLRERQARPRLWELILEHLRVAGQELEAETELSDALEGVESSIDSLTPLSTEVDSPSSLQIGSLTRRHLRQVMTFFLASRDSDHTLPFDRLGSGTSNVLVFALLGEIAAVKDNVIFAMEEPEIALPAHTQRVVIKRLKTISQQAVVTSHSPYVAEQFLPEGLVAVRRSGDGALTSSSPDADQYVKEKTLRRDFRTRFAEGLLARAIVLVEGITELWALPAPVDVLATVDGTGFRGFDLDGIVFVPSDGSGQLRSLAGYFGSVGIPVVVVCDQLTEDDDREGLEAVAHTLIEHEYRGFESLLAAEMPLPVIQRVCNEATGWADYPTHLELPAAEAPDEQWRTYFRDLLQSRKGEGYAARFLSRCAADEMPTSLLVIIRQILEALAIRPLEPEDPVIALLAAADQAVGGV